MEARGHDRGVAAVLRGPVHGRPNGRAPGGAASGAQAGGHTGPGGGGVVWLQDNGHDDEAQAVAAFWPAIADSVRLGSMTLGVCLSLLARDAPELARLAGRLQV